MQCFVLVLTPISFSPIPFFLHFFPLLSLFFTNHCSPSFTCIRVNYWKLSDVLHSLYIFGLIPLNLNLHYLPLLLPLFLLLVLSQYSTVPNMIYDWCLPTILYTMLRHSFPTQNFLPLQSFMSVPTQSLHCPGPYLLYWSDELLPA